MRSLLGFFNEFVTSNVSNNRQIQIGMTSLVAHLSPGAILQVGSAAQGAIWRVSRQSSLPPSLDHWRRAKILWDYDEQSFVPSAKPHRQSKYLNVPSGALKRAIVGPETTLNHDPLSTATGTELWDISPTVSEFTL